MNIEQETLMRNNQTYVDYLNRLKLIAISLFKWNGLEEIGGNSRFLEMALYENGRAVFCKDSNLGYLTLRVNPSDKYNVYNIPTKVIAYSLEYNKEYPIDEVVYIMNNNLQIPTSQTISLMARRLYEVERSIDVNIANTRTPVLIEGDKKTELTLKNLYMQYDGNTPVIFGNKNFELQNRLNVLKTDAPYLVDKLELHKHELWNEALTYLGINNSNTDKKERVNTLEVESNNDLIKYYLNCFLEPRLKACKEINDKFFEGREVVSVSIDSDILNAYFNIDEDINLNDNEVE